jgi:nitrate reductase NapE
VQWRTAYARQTARRPHFAAAHAPDTPRAIHCRPIARSYAGGINTGDRIMDERTAPSTKQEELRTFLFLAVVMAPVIAVAVVGGYGFVVWMFQVATGQLPTG